MRYVSHPLADRMRPYLSPTELGVIIHANHNICWARKNNNPTMHRLWNCLDQLIYGNNIDTQYISILNPIQHII